jgi:hypothetical protein
MASNDIGSLRQEYTATYNFPQIKTLANLIK